MMPENKLIFFLFFACLLIAPLVAQSENTPDDYAFELLKHYLGHNELELAKNVIETQQFSENKADSVAWLSASLYYFQNDLPAAAQGYAKVFAVSKNDSLLYASANKLAQIVPKLQPRTAIDIVVEVVSNIKDNTLYFKMIILLAELYEDNFLFAEANDIYISLLEGDFAIQDHQLYLKIATNQIFQKKYSEAVSFAGKAEALQDSLKMPQALVIQFIGYQAQDLLAKALIPLLKLYLYFPDFSYMYDIVSNLAQLLVHEGYFMLAWFVLENYLPHASELEKVLIDTEINNIKKLIWENDDSDQQYFKFFTPRLEDIINQ
jgi:hypothetical protein